MQLDGVVGRGHLLEQHRHALVCELWRGADAALQRLDQRFAGDANLVARGGVEGDGKVAGRYVEQLVRVSVQRQQPRHRLGQPEGEHEAARIPLAVNLLHDVHRQLVPKVFAQLLPSLGAQPDEQLKHLPADGPRVRLRRRVRKDALGHHGPAGRISPPPYPRAAPRAHLSSVGGPGTASSLRSAATACGIATGSPSLEEKKRMRASAAVAVNSAASPPRITAASSRRAPPRSSSTTDVSCALPVRGCGCRDTVLSGRGGVPHPSSSTNCSSLSPSRPTATPCVSAIGLKWGRCGSGGGAGEWSGTFDQLLLGGPSAARHERRNESSQVTHIRKRAMSDF